MEAMSSGLPVIVSNKGGPKTFVTEDFGYVLDINSIEDITKAIKNLAQKDEVYFQKSEKAYCYMRDKSISHSFWSSGGIIRKFINYCRLLKRLFIKFYLNFALYFYFVLKNQIVLIVL